MHLKSLKLSGFKSFVDTSKFDFPSHLVGIIGPNGCGKSNAIDAVRWVMGERSAKHLRGYTMSDIIFNGSRNRKPIGKASVEMLFDNSEGLITGEYAAYREVLVKRTATRDGQSQYFLNNTKVRRRDVMDLFLGTGLGGNSYAIIEQGMISRFIDSKPDDIRRMLEEAAGISQYKERRRETENRMKNTRENLARVLDLNDEIIKNINRLDRQAKSAQRYKTLNLEKKHTHAKLLALEWSVQNKKVEVWREKINKKTNEIEANRAKLQGNAAQIEVLHQNKINDSLAATKAQDALNATQSFLERLEEKSKSLKTNLAQAKSDLEEMDLDRVSKNITADKKLIESLEAWLSEHDPHLNRLKKKLEVADQKRREIEEKWQKCQTQCQESVHFKTIAEKTYDSEANKIIDQNHQRKHLKNRLQALQQEKQQMPIHTKNHALKADYTKVLAQLEKLQTEQGDLKKAIADLRVYMNEHKQSHANLQKQFQENSGRLASLETLQQNALNQPENIEWLTSQQWHQNPKLAEIIQIESGWEQAVELVLGGFLQAICLASERLPNQFAPKAPLSLLQNKDKSQAQASSERGEQLLDKIVCDYDLSDMLRGVICVTHITDALSLQDDLKVGESAITQDGFWVGKNWIKVLAKSANNEQNIIKREAEIRQLRTQCRKEKQQIEISEQHAEQQMNKLQQLERQLEQIQNQFNTVQSKSADLQSEKSALAAKNEQIEQRESRIKDEIREINERVEQIEIVTKVAQDKSHEMKLQIEKLAQICKQFEIDKASLQRDLEQSREVFEVQRIQLQDQLVQTQAKRTELNTTIMHSKRIKDQMDRDADKHSQLESRKSELTKQLPNVEREIAETIQKRLTQETVLKEAKQLLNQNEYDYQEKIEISKKLTQSIQDLQVQLSEYKINAQESITLKKSKGEQIRITGFDIDDLLEQINHDDDEQTAIDDYQRQLQTLGQKIQRLGEINFASIDEFKSEVERKVFIEKQMKDLQSALNTLKQAIGKIDRETKDRFKETFDIVNQGVSQLFPELFGGGRAYLEMTDDDLLETGVTIMAQPPGKRNSSIHLLSGGEKALTAVSFIFAIFEINPAPFCMLDEVDAPLDDVNVQRFCNMVKKMSDKIQFIFITHNKITMELSHQLMGVTMHEPGVSRLVSVDISEAIKMAEV